MKGASHEYPARRVIAFIKELGLEAHDLVLRSDQEPALQDLLNLIGRKRIPAKTFYELSPVDLRHQTAWQREEFKQWRDRSECSRTF